jgi:hypothetical protein
VCEHLEKEDFFSKLLTYKINVLDVVVPIIIFEGQNAKKVVLALRMML